MITELRLRNFKNFEDATLRLGSFTVLVGTNGSGKSNIWDAFRFLHGAGQGYSLPDIIGGRYGAGGQSEWPQLRGAANEIVRFGAAGFAIEVKLHFNNEPGHSDAAHYHVGVDRSDLPGGEFRMASETLQMDGTVVYSSDRGGGHIPLMNGAPDFKVLIANADPRKWSGFSTFNQPVLDLITLSPALDPNIRVQVKSVRDAFLGMRFLELMPGQMRLPAFPGQTVLGDGGENLPSVLQDICQNPDRKNILIDWLQELTPMDVVDLEFPRDPSGLIHLMLKERSGHSVSAYSASDGTLRFLGLLAALLGKNPAKLYFFEEIETGIHPSRLKLLLDLIEHQTSKNDIQVITTTHSPELLSMISDSTFNNTSVIYRASDVDHAIIRPLAELPDAVRLRSEQGLGRLLTSGWMEDVLSFNEEAEPTAAK